MSEQNKKLTVIGKVTINVENVRQYFNSEDGLKDAISLFGENFWTSDTVDLFERWDNTFDKAAPHLDVENPKYKDFTYTFKFRKSQLLYFLNDVSNILDEIQLDLVKIEDNFYHITIPKDGEKSYRIPKKLVSHLYEYETFDNRSIAEVLQLKDSPEDSSVKHELSDISDKSKNEIVTTIEQKKAQAEKLEAELKLEVAEIEKKMAIEISKAKQKIAQVMEPVVLEIETLTDKLHLFESQIYSVLSYLGLTGEFKQIAKGEKASKSEPLVVWQKLRYLNEELPKLASLEMVSFNDAKLFEQLLVEQPLVRDFFLPNEKTITVLKVSRKGTLVTYNSHQREGVKKGETPWTDFVLSTTELMHGHKLALLIRNGENIYVVWTDEDKIFVSDDNLFYTADTVDADVQEVEYYDLDDVDKYSESSKGTVALRNIETTRKNFDKRRRYTKKPYSRVYLKAIIEGLLERGEIIDIPEKEDLSDAVLGKTKYIKFRSADLVLKDTQYGTMKDLYDKTHKQDPRYGEDVYVITRDNGESRGKGYRNTTHDVYLSPGLNKISLTEYTWTYLAARKLTDDMLDKNDNWTEQYHYLRGSIPNKKTGEVYKRVTEVTTYSRHENPPSEAFIEKKMNSRDIYTSEKSDIIQKEIIDGIDVTSGDRVKYRSLRELGFVFKPEATELDTRWFVSLEKSYSANNANTRIYDDEFINLTFWNSTWLAYAIRNHHTFSNFLRGDYASQLPHLQAMLSFLQNREKQYLVWLNKHYEGQLPKNWQVELSEWQLEKDYHNITEFRIKQFAKVLYNKYGGSNK